MATAQDIARAQAAQPQQPNQSELGMGAFQNYQDAAFAQAQRHLAPAQDLQQKKFEQTMINKGLDPGSKAYNLAQAQMQRGQTDQQNAAAFGAMQFGQQAQGQAFGQDFQNRQMSQQNQQFGRSLNQAQNQFGRSLGEQGRQFDVGMSQRESEFGRNLGLQQDQFGFQQGQADFSNMLGLGNLALQFGNFANQGIMSDYNMAQGQLGSAPNAGVFGIDTQGAYNAGMTGANNVYQGQLAQYGTTMGALGNIAGAALMPSALEFKIMHGVTSMKSRNRIAAKMLTMPIYDWEYKPQYKERGDHDRFGVLANDFNGHFIGDDEEQLIDLQRYTSALHLTIQEMFYEVRRLENLLWHVAEAQGIPMDAKSHSGKKGMGQVFDIAERIDNVHRHWTPVPELEGA
jgi:hypothetical protein